MRVPVPFESAIRLLRLWEGFRVTVTATDEDGTELARTCGLLADRSTVDPPQLEFGLDDPGDPTATFPLALDGPYRCTFSEDAVSITAGGGAVLLVTLDRNVPRGLTDQKRRPVE